MREVVLTKDFIELYILLKLENLASSGGEAKFFISEGQVKLNGKVETRKRKKLIAGDIIEFSSEKLCLIGQ